MAFYPGQLTEPVPESRWQDTPQRFNTLTINVNE